MALNVIITAAGRAELINAENTGTAPVQITQIGFTAATFTPTAALTALPSEAKRVSSIAGEVVAPDTISVTAKDEGTTAYTVRGFGVYTASGTLFAVYGQAAPVIEKAAAATLLLTIDIILADINAASLTFGDITFSNPPASLTTPGVVTLNNATNSTAQNQAATPRAVKAANDNANTRLVKTQNLADLANAETARQNLGLGEAARRNVATRTDALAGTDNEKLATMLRVFEAFQQYGLGRASLGDTSMVEQLSSGFYRTFSNDPDSPTANAGTWIEIARDVSSGWRLFMNYGSDRLFFQRTTAAGKYEWREVYHDGNILKIGTTAASARAALELGSAALQADNRYAHRSNNLSDLPSPTQARSNLGLSTAATMGTTASRTSTSTDVVLQAKAMNDHRQSDDHDARYARRSNNLSDLANATTARQNLGLGEAARRDVATRTDALAGTDNEKLASMLRVFEAFGQFGLGRAGLGDTSMADQLPSGFYRTFSNDPDSPTGNAGTWMEVSRDAVSGWRLFMNTSSDRLFFHRFMSGKQEWREVYHSGNLSPVQTTGTQTISGAKTLTSRLLIENAGYNEHLKLRRDTLGVDITLTTTGNGRVVFLPVGPVDQVELRGLSLSAASFAGDLNASDLKTGTVPNARLPSDILRHADVGEEPGKILPVGAFGVGGAAPIAHTFFGSTNLDDYTKGGEYTTTGQYTNGPAGPELSTLTGLLIVSERAYGQIYQRYIGTSTGGTVERIIGQPWYYQYSERNLPDAFPGDIRPTGWTREPNGLIKQWGFVTIPQGATKATVSLPTAFPNEPFRGVATRVSDAVSSEDTPGIAITKTSVTVSASGLSGTRTFNYWVYGN
ncbi:tail fiber protein [Vreelandella profundi]|uniref:tail fiber protein n=1 Tax=Vreelandella profundi TaxID=2852117 RepID=UPI001F3FBE78|nr:tail fiber protein [Halomonas profundi]